MERSAMLLLLLCGLLGSTTPTSAATPPARLFSLNVEVGVNVTAPLHVHEGAVPKALAEAFAQAHPALDAATAVPLIVQGIVKRYAAFQREQAPAKLLFSLDVQVDGQTVGLPVREGDKPNELAVAFAAKHSLAPEAHAQIVRAILARAEKLTRPLFTLNINVDSAQQAVPLQVFEGDKPNDVAATFVARHKLTEGAKGQIVTAIINRFNSMQRKVLFTLPVSLPNDARAELVVRDGDKPEDLAAAFVKEHSLRPEAASAITRAILEEAVAKGLVQK